MIDCNFGIVLHGPFHGTDDYKVGLDGKLVPYLRVREGAKILGHFASEPDPTTWEVVLDGRMSWMVPKEHAGCVLSLLANGIALGAGRACFGGPLVDPFNVGIGALPIDARHERAKSILRDVNKEPS